MLEVFTDMYGSKISSVFVPDFSSNYIMAIFMGNF